MYHVMNRGNRKQFIFEDDQDRRVFVRIFVDTQAVYGVQLLAGSLMDNHFHLGVLTPHGNLSEFMQQLEGQFARYSNWRHGRVGHLFQGRFRHVLIEHDLHLLAALCYILMNPLAAGLVTKLEDYPWSTYAATAGYKPAPSYLTIDWLEALFPAASLREAQGRFRAVMAASRPVAAFLEDCELNVSPETVTQAIRSYTGEQVRLGSFPAMYRGALRPTLEELLAQLSNDRARFIREARVSCGYKHAEIARALHVQPATVSRIFRASRRQDA